MAIARFIQAAMLSSITYIHIESESQGYLKLNFRLYLESLEDSADCRYLDIEDTSNISDLYLFISLTRGFMSELSRFGDR